MNSRGILFRFAFLLLLVGSSVVVECGPMVPTSPVPTGTSALTPSGSPMPGATVHPTAPLATPTSTPKPTLTPTPSVSPTPPLDLVGACYLYFPPKTKYDTLDYPYRGNLYRIDPNTGHIDLLLTGDIKGFTTSPDGSQLAYIRRGAEGDQLVVRDLVADRDWTLFTGQQEIGEPVWSPDGQELAFSQYATDNLDLWNTGEVWIVRVDDRTTRKLADGFNPTWSPDSQQLAYVTRPRVPPYEQNSLMVVDRFGKKRQAVFDTDPQTWKAGQSIDFDPEYSGPLLVRPSWSPDGHYLLFSVNARFQSLYRIRIDSGEMLELGLGIKGQFVRGSDRVVTLASEGQGWITLYLLVVTSRGGDKSTLSQNGDIVMSFTLSPDGQHVAFVSTNQEWSRLTFSVYDLQAGKELLRQELFGDVGGPHLAPRGLEWAPQ